MRFSANALGGLVSGQVAQSRTLGVGGTVLCLTEEPSLSGSLLPAGLKPSRLASVSCWNLHKSSEGTYQKEEPKQSRDHLQFSVPA